MHSWSEQALGSIVRQIEGKDRVPSGLDPIEAPALLRIAEVEELTRMKRANIYRLIKRGDFPAPIHLGGAKWHKNEVEEFIQRRTDERDRKQGANKFVPRPGIASNRGATSSDLTRSFAEPGAYASRPTSTIRMLGPELCEALRMLKVDIPELYVDPALSNVVLAVIKIELPFAQPAAPGSKRKKR